MDMMDIEMEFECGACGWLFTKSFLQLEHGSVMKCPFCAGTSLGIRSEAAVSESGCPGKVEHMHGARYALQSKIKL